MLDITGWIHELADDIQTAQPLIGPLRRLGKENCADELANDIRNMRESMEALRRLGESRGKRRGRPPLWLVELNQSGEPEAQPTEGRGRAKKGGA